MNDDMRERLSAYLDGALSEPERRSIDAQLERSADLRRELEDLRAISRAVKGLPKEKLPAGFLARLQAKRAAGETPRAWVLLPPAYRPVAAAMSAAVVALVLWDRSIPKPENSISAVAYSDMAPVPVKRAEDVPPTQMDLSRQVAGSPAPQALAPSAVFEAAEAKSADSFGSLAGAGAAPSVASRKRVSAPGRPLGEGASAAEASVAAANATPEFYSEEQRSAANERFQAELEKEKKRLGIVKIIEKDEEPPSAMRYDPEAAASMRRAMAAYQEKPAAPINGGRAEILSKSSVAAARGSGAKVKAAPTGLILNTPEALAAAWAAAGLPGDPPAIDFPNEAAAFLLTPATTVIGFEARATEIIVLYASVPGSLPSARVRAVPPGKPARFVAVPPPATR